MTDNEIGRVDVLVDTNINVQTDIDSDGPDGCVRNVVLIDCNAKSAVDGNDTQVILRLSPDEVAHLIAALTGAVREIAEAGS
jgi:hypothetical protein